MVTGRRGANRAILFHPRPRARLFGLEGSLANHAGQFGQRGAVFFAPGLGQLRTVYTILRIKQYVRGPKVILDRRPEKIRPSRLPAAKAAAAWTSSGPLPAGLNRAARPLTSARKPAASLEAARTDRPE